MNYLLAKNDLKVSVHRERYASDYTTKTIDKEIVLSIDQVKALFTKLMDLRLVNRCVSGIGTGNPNDDEISFTYSVNGKKYELIISGMDSLWSLQDDANTDKDLFDAFDKSKDATEGTEVSDCVYEFDGFKSSLLDEYFN